MMIPFTEGDESCVCKGKGFIDHQFGTLEAPRIIRGVCPKCVQFKEATLETIEYDNEDGYHKRDGRVVPEE